MNLFGTGGMNMGGGDVSSALQGVSLGVSWEPDLWGRMRYGRNAFAGYLRLGPGRFRVRPAIPGGHDGEELVHRRRDLAATPDYRGDGQGVAGIGDTGGETLEVGPGNEQDVALARANLGTFQDTAKQVRLAHEQTLRALELLLGRYPAAELQARHDLPALPGPSRRLPLEMLERRPDMLAAERRVAAAFNRVGEAKAARLPRIILNANVAAIQSDILQLKSDFQNPTAGAGAKLIAPLYKGGALKTQVKIRRSNKRKPSADYASMALRALGDVENALAAGKRWRSATYSCNAP